MEAVPIVNVVTRSLVARKWNLDDGQNITGDEDWKQVFRDLDGTQHLSSDFCAVSFPKKLDAQNERNCRWMQFSEDELR